ncbi:MAG TPA: threonine synthase [Methylomirabilota bacterium]|jgi:threonine synthase|nr:threonine synthase [Methylomirabilota bacterium]
MDVPATCALGLRCIECSAEHPLEYLLACPRCRGLLEPVYDLERLRRLGPAAAFTGRGFWRYHAVLPIRDPAHRVTLGEGETPLLEAPALARTLGVRRLLLKFEGTNPTGTIKDRSSATAVAAARQFGFRAISVASTGNAGSSIGAYATRAGLRAFIFCYEQASAPKMHHMGAVASDLILYQGYYDDLIRLWDRMVDELPVFDGGASRNAYKQEGKKTLVYEIAEQSGFRIPDVVVFPVAVGEAFIAGWRGFRELAALGWIERVPLMAAAQSAKANPIARAFRHGGPLAPVKVSYSVAEGLSCGDPAQKGEWVLRILRESKGLATDVEDEAILDTQRLLARTEGLYAGPTGVGTLAALRRLLGERAVDPDQTFCCIISETGLKTEAPVAARTGQAFTYERLVALVRDRLGA